MKNLLPFPAGLWYTESIQSGHTIRSRERSPDMRIWKILSGVLSIAIAALVAFPSFFAGLLNITGQSTGGAGMAVAVMLLAGGAVSIASSRGSMAADIALICLYGVGSLVGFTMFGTYDSLLLWALWCLLCAALAVVDFFVSYFSEDRPSAGPEPDAPAAPEVPTLRSVILEHSPKKREAVIDALPERDAKNYLKQAVTALINRAPILPPELEDDDEGPRPGRTAIVAAACTALVFIAGIVIFFTLRGGRDSGAPAPSASPSAPAASAAPTPAPSASPSPSGSPSGSPSEPPAGTGSGDLGDYHVEIQDAFIADDFEGNPAIIITYTWANNSDETVSALAALSEKAFQNGVQIDRAVVYSRDTPGYDSGTASRSIRPGAESEVQCAFTLRDRVSVVEFEVTEFISLSDSMVSMNFDPQTLNTVE